MADFDLNAILNSLSPEDMENIKKAAASFMGNMGEETSPHSGKPPDKQNSAEGKRSADTTGDIFSGLGMPDLSQLASLAPIFQAFNSHDERLDFINALKPLLSEERRHKADEAMKLVKLMSVLPLLRERGIM